MQTRTLLVVFCAAAAVLIAALWLGGGESMTSSAQAPHVAPAAQDSRAETELLAPAPDAEPSAALASERGVVRAAVERTPARATLRGFVLRDGGPVAGARVKVSRGVSNLAQDAARTEPVNVTRAVRGQREAREYVGPGTDGDWEGRFSIDVSSLFLSGIPAALWIEVSAPTSDTNHFEVPLSQFARDSAQADFEHDVVLELEPACAVIVTFAFPPVDSTQHELPRDTAPHLTVVQAAGGGATRTDGASRWEQRADGEHEIGLECGQSYLLLAAARGWRPIGLRVQPVAETRLGRFELERGVSVSGRVVSDGAPTRAIVTLELVGGGERIRFLNDEFCEFNGVYERASLSVPTDANGEFRAEGLAAAPYRVRVVPSDNPHATGDVATQIEAPADKLTIPIELGRLDLRVRRGGQPAVGQLISIHHRSANGNSGGSLVTDSDGAAVLRMRHDQRTTLELRWREFEGGPMLVREIDAPFPGIGQRAEFVIDL